MRQAYKDILKCYHGSEALKKGGLVSYPNADVMAFRRVYENKEVLVIVNVRNKNVSYSIANELVSTSWDDAFNGLSVTLQESVDLAAYEYLVLTR